MTPTIAPARYAVVGNPVAHSLSPRIHAEFARQTGQTLSYEAIELPRDGFELGLRDLQQRGYAGLNVTVPFKQDAFRVCNSTSERARRAEVVNTLLLADNGAIHGDNTDGVGLLRDLTLNLGLELGDRDILVVGAGGAVRGVLGPLLEAGPARLVLANRTPQKAEQLAADFAASGNISSREFAALAGDSFDLIVNGTAAGLSGELPPLPDGLVGGDSFCYDMMYRLDTPTAFVAWARQQGAARACDGLGMLVEQAAAAFTLWRGAEPDGRAVIELLRRS